MNSVLVTGAGGFVGRALIAETAARGNVVRGTSRLQGGIPKSVNSTVVADVGPCFLDVQADPVFFRIEFIGADDAINYGLAIFVFERDPRAEEHAGLIAGRLRDDF